MSTNISDITLQSTDGTLVAKNYGGALVYPMLCLDREPTQADADMLQAEGWDAVLVCVDGDEAGGRITVSQTDVYLNEDNNYFQSILLFGEGAWTISGVDEDCITVETSSGQNEGIGTARLDIEATQSLKNQPGSYNSFFMVTISSTSGETVRINVHIAVSVPLTVKDEENNTQASDGGTLTVNLNEGNGYTADLTIIRDRDWQVESVANFDRIIVTPLSGDGNSTLTVTKSDSPDLINTTTADITRTAVFRIVSFYQQVQVNVNITIPPPPPPDPPTLTFVDPRPGTDEAGATGTDPIYLYV